LSEKTFPLPALSFPWSRAERVLALKHHLEQVPEAERSWRLAMMEQRVKQANRIDLMAGIAEYRGRLESNDWNFEPRKLTTPNELADGLAITLWKKPEAERESWLAIYEKQFEKVDRPDLLEAVAILRATVTFLREIQMIEIDQ
jgi:hypothetical protein